MMGGWVGMTWDSIDGWSRWSAGSSLGTRDDGLGGFM